jgi:hypothetical protein
MLCQPACEIGDGMRHGVKKEPPLAPAMTAEEMAHGFIDGVRLKTEEDVILAAVALLAVEMAAEPSIRTACKEKFIEVNYGTPNAPSPLTVHRALTSLSHRM